MLEAYVRDVSATDLSAIYEGHVVHQRLAPRRHHLRYAMFQILFDLDHLGDPRPPPAVVFAQSA